MPKVLVVDDTKNIRLLLTMCLEMEGYEVTAAADGKQALELLQNNSFAFAFLDIKLPELSGTEVLRQLRESGNNTPVIIMTAFGTVKNAVECTKLGAVIYLQKPFSAEKIKTVIAEISEYLTGNPQELQEYLDQAKNNLQQGNHTEALKILKKALALNPSHGETYRLLGELYGALGDQKAANRFQFIAGQFEE